MINRREFGKKLSGGVIGAGIGGSVDLGSVPVRAAHVPRKNTLMHVGADYHSVAGGGRYHGEGKVGIQSAPWRKASDRKSQKAL